MSVIPEIWFTWQDKIKQYAKMSVKVDIFGPSNKCTSGLNPGSQAFVGRSQLWKAVDTHQGSYVPVGRLFLDLFTKIKQLYFHGMSSTTHERYDRVMFNLCEPSSAQSVIKKFPLRRKSCCQAQHK